MSGDAAGPAVEAPRSGKRVRYLETAEATDGEYARFEMWLAPPPESHGPMKHVHPEQEEVLEVLDGRLGVWHEGTTRRLGPGERTTIPAGDRHRFWNAGAGELHLVGEVRPALRTERFMYVTYGLGTRIGLQVPDTATAERFMYVTYGLGRDHPATPSGMPLNPLRMAPIVDEFDDLLYLASVPIPIQRFGVGLLAALGRLLGYTAEYPEYVPPERRDGSDRG